MSLANLESFCPVCGSGELEVEVVAAAHDPRILDIVVTCLEDEGGCGRRLNGFLSLADMMELEA